MILINSFPHQSTTYLTHNHTLFCQRALLKVEGTTYPWMCEYTQVHSSMPYHSRMWKIFNNKDEEISYFNFFQDEKLLSFSNGLIARIIFPQIKPLLSFRCLIQGLFISTTSLVLLFTLKKRHKTIFKIRPYF